MEEFYIIKRTKFALKKWMCISKQDVRQSAELILADQIPDK
jgi:hypothetical protein